MIARGQIYATAKPDIRILVCGLSTGLPVEHVVVVGLSVVPYWNNNGLSIVETSDGDAYEIPYLDCIPVSTPIFENPVATIEDQLLESICSRDEFMFIAAQRVVQVLGRK